MPTTPDYEPNVEYIKALIDGFEKALSTKTKNSLYDDYVITTRSSNRRLVPKDIFLRDFIRPIITLKLMQSEKAAYFEGMGYPDINYILQLETNHQTAKDVENNVFRFLRHPKNKKKFSNVYDTLSILIQETQDAG